jgi:hypothetical protein
MRTTVDLPDAMVERIKIAAARRRTTMRSLFIQGIESVLGDELDPEPSAEAVDRLRKGYHLGGRPLTREEIHAR